jgi:hypothetical protein
MDMETRDLGTHSVELHEQGTLDIVGSGVRLTLPAHEARELLQWLDAHKEILDEAILREQEARQQQLPPWIRTQADENELDLPVDEP